MHKKFTPLPLFIFIILSLSPFLFANTPSAPQTVLSNNTATPYLTGAYFNFSSPLNFILAGDHYTANSVISTQPITICSGASIVIQGDNETLTPDSYSWEVLQGSAWINAPGVNNTADYTPSLLINNTAADILFSIRRKITISGSSGYDSNYDVTVQPSAQISNNVITGPTASTLCSPGNPGAITGSTPTGGNGTYIYQWQSSVDNVNFNNITSANSISYTPPQLTVTTYYRRTVSGGSCVVPSSSSAVAIVIIQPVTNNTITAPAINNFCSASDPAAITGNIPSGGDGTYTYQWQQSTDNTNFTNITGAVSKDYDPPVISVTTYYRRSAISGACATPVYSNVISVAILPALTNNVITAPAVSTFCVSGDAAVITGNTPSGGNNTYAYQWQQSTDDVNFTNIPSATNASYDPPVVTASTYYRRTITSGQCTTPVLSNVVTIKTVAVPVVPVPSQASVTACSGSPATLSVASPQADLIYNWYDSPAKTTLLYTGPNYVTPNQTVNKTFYVESSNGLCTSATMASVQVVIAIPPTAPAVTSSTVTTCSNTTATLSILSPQAGYHYKWYHDIAGDDALADGITFTTTAIIANTIYYVKAVNATGCISPRTAVNVNMLPLPQVSVQGASVCPGTTATLSATTDAANATIKWYANTSGGPPLFTGSTVTIPALNSNTSYYVEVTNNTTGCISAPRQLVEAKLLQPLAAPVVTAGPPALGSVTFSWAAVTDAVAYQVSIDNGTTYTAPSSGSAGLSHTITGLLQDQSVTILVRAIGASGCQLSASSVAVTAKPKSLTDEIFVPNAFTPNGDGKNDIVYVHSEGIKTIKFYVYDQWGELLFSTTNIANGWDGTYKGSKEPAGVYVYYLQAVMNNGNSLNKKGTITLLR